DDREDTGVIEALLARLNEYRLPRLLELKERVDRGEAIGDNDVQLLERVLDDGREIEPLIARNPKVQSVYAQVTALHAEITAKAVENEQKPKT
ncbi:MAG: hypothetical protein KDI33_07255, partial [Halioglobus sp.]|nr:hypothetical protein [Halioglobus sp.]